MHNCKILIRYLPTCLIHRDFRYLMMTTSRLQKLVYIYCITMVLGPPPRRERRSRSPLTSSTRPSGNAAVRAEVKPTGAAGDEATKDKTAGKQPQRAASRNKQGGRKRTSSSTRSSSTSSESSSSGSTRSASSTSSSSASSSSSRRRHRRERGRASGGPRGRR